MKLFVEDALFEDLKQINELLRLSKAYWGYDTEFLERFMAKLGITQAYMKDHTIKLFYAEDQLVGFFNFGFNTEGIFELDNFFLHPDCIGKGLGRKLWITCCGVAKKQGQNEFIIWSDPNVESFYLKMGCEKIGARKSPMMPDRYPPVLRYKLFC